MKQKNISRGLYKKSIIIDNVKEHTAWANMKARCNNVNNPAYHNYGGRGIDVCMRWDSYENFFNDMGKSAPHLSLERIDNDKGYYPGNCKWATKSEQISNRRYLFNSDKWKKRKFNSKVKKIMKRMHVLKNHGLYCIENDMLFSNAVNCAKYLGITHQAVSESLREKRKIHKKYTIVKYFNYFNAILS